MARTVFSWQQIISLIFSKSHCIIFETFSISFGWNLKPRRLCSLLNMMMLKEMFCFSFKRSNIVLKLRLSAFFAFKVQRNYCKLLYWGQISFDVSTVGNRPCRLLKSEILIDYVGSGKVWLDREGKEVGRSGLRKRILVGCTVWLNEVKKEPILPRGGIQLN